MRLDYDIADDSEDSAALGLILLQVDETIEDDFRRLMPATGVRLYHSRVGSAAEVTPESLPHMTSTLPAAAALLPAQAGLDVIGYACTSGATMLGEAAVAGLIGAAHPGVLVTDPLTALKAACAALGLRRLGLVSPYVAEVSDALRLRLAAVGVAVTAFGSFEQKEERVVARISTASILSALQVVGEAEGCEAVFASCTNLRATAVVEAAERALGKPVLTSNTVLAWHMLRLAGVDGEVRGAGALAHAPLPPTAAA